MMQYRLSAISNLTSAKAFGKPAMSISCADKYAPKTGANYNNLIWYRSFRQSLYIPILS